MKKRIFFLVMLGCFVFSLMAVGTTHAKWYKKGERQYGNDEQMSDSVPEFDENAPLPEEDQEYLPAEEENNIPGEGQEDLPLMEEDNVPGVNQEDPLLQEYEPVQQEEQYQEEIQNQEPGN